VLVLTIVLGLLGLGIMIFVHELGHFLAAKAVGIEVEVFSLGWGRRFLGFTRRGTTYQLAVFPVGGYCRLKGEDAYRAAIRERRDTFPDVPGSFFSASPLRRIIVAVCGPAANVLFAVAVLSVIWLAGFNVLSSDNRIVLASDYTLDYKPTDAPPPATRAGLRTGDRVTAIDGRPIGNFQELTERVAMSAGRTLRFTVERGGSQIQAGVTPELDKQTGGGRIGVYAWNETVVESVRVGSSGHLAGLLRGDRIVSTDGRPVAHLIDLAALLSVRPERVLLGVEREGSLREVDMKVFYDASGNADLGLTFRLNVYRSPRLSVPGAVAAGAREAVRSVDMAVTGIATLFKGVNLRNAVAGPLRISYYVGAVATSGFATGFGAGVVSFFRFLCLLSVTLFVMNLLPLPALDGGQIVVFVVEAVRRRPARPRVVNAVQLAGFAVVASLLLVFTVSDILFFIGR
jgi:regulator of sigma E protease